MDELREWLIFAFALAAAAFLLADNRRRRIDGRKQQASRIWGIPIDGARVQVRNDSELPVYSVAATLIDTESHHRATCGPQAYLAPAQEWLAAPNTKWSGSASDSPARLRVVFDFTDASGLRWRRHDDGRLEVLGETWLQRRVASWGMWRDRTHRR